MAKMMDLWGRAESFLFMVCLATLGLVLMAASRNLAMYCAADVCSRKREYVLFWPVPGSNIADSLVFDRFSTRLDSPASFTASACWQPMLPTCGTEDLHLPSPHPLI